MLSSKAENLNIEAKEITLNKQNNTSIFENDVIIKTNEGKQIFSDFAEYNKKLGLIKLKGNIKVVDDKNNIIETNYAEYNEKNNCLKQRETQK